MKKFYLLFILAVFLNTSNAFAWEMDNYTDLPADSAEIEKNKAQNIEQNRHRGKKKGSQAAQLGL